MRKLMCSPVKRFVLNRQEHYQTWKMKCCVVSVRFVLSVCLVWLSVVWCGVRCRASTWNGVCGCAAPAVLCFLPLCFGRVLQGAWTNLPN